MMATRRCWPRGWLEVGLAIAFAISASPRSAGAAPDCAAWPGEPDPLPSASATDALSAQWAHDRAGLLSGLASELELLDPDAARRLHGHALCLDPGRSLDQAALERPLPSHRALPRPLLRSVPEARLAALDEGLAGLERSLEAARFRDVLVGGGRLRTRLAALESAPAVLERQAALELLVATAYTALGRNDDATLSMSRALEAEPDLELAPESSPKLRRLLARVRTPRSAGQ